MQLHIYQSQCGNIYDVEHNNKSGKNVATYVFLQMNKMAFNKKGLEEPCAFQIEFFPIGKKMLGFHFGLEMTLLLTRYSFFQITIIKK